MDIDAIIQILVPVIFFILYAVSQVMGGENDKNKRQQGGGGENLTEEERRIRDEIRRKIVEHQQRGYQGDTRPPEVVIREQQIAARKAQENEAKQRAEEQRQRREERRTTSAYQQTQSHTHEVHQEKTRDFGAELADQMENLKAAREKNIRVQAETGKRIEKSRKQASKETRQPKNAYDFAVARISNVGPTVRRSFHNPSAAKLAFVYAEVIGKPVSLRRQQGFEENW